MPPDRHGAREQLGQARFARIRDRARRRGAVQLRRERILAGPAGHHGERAQEQHLDRARRLHEADDVVVLARDRRQPERLGRPPAVDVPERAEQGTAMALAQYDGPYQEMGDAYRGPCERAGG